MTRTYDPENALRSILEGTSSAATGREFFDALVRRLAEALGTHGAWVTELVPDTKRMRAVAFWLAGNRVADYEYDYRGTACERVVEDRRLVHLPDRALELYPNDTDFASHGIVSYLGVPLLDLDGNVLGHLAVMDDRPLPEDPRLLAIFQIFASRAAAELRRGRTESRIREGEERLRTLAAEADRLREELRVASGFGEILGSSEPMRRLQREIDDVAGTDATVLILGETGTGKELVARAIHARSRRSGGPLVKVNCGAMPGSLIESELFGHEKGAFTGATHSRPGRFALAHGGTIFLDEIGELPLELQPKLLRVLQEGEIEPVGSSKTQRVDVRVVAATNRDLAREVAERRFRQDLFYRVNVFPVRVPALRERGDDVRILAASFVDRCAERMGRRVTSPSSEQMRRLVEHSWPGNVRELQNVIERAVISARDGRLDLANALGLAAGARPALEGNAPDGAGGERILSVQEIEDLERRNIERALEACAGQIAGDRGAAFLLGMKPSTLASRMKALGIERSRPSEA